MLREDFRQQIHFRSIVRLEQFTPMCPKRNSIMKKEGDFTLFFLLSHISLHDSPLTVADKHDNFILSLEAGISASILSIASELLRPD